MNLTIKGVPPGLHRKLKQRAEKNRRSLNSEVLNILEQAPEYQPWPDPELLNRIRQVRSKIKAELTKELLGAATNQGRP